MPEIVPTYDRLVEAVGGGDLEARFLSHWNPPPLFAACSLAAWSRDRRVLVRNYDYPPTLCDALVLRSGWTGTQVLAMSDCLLGALDGVNEHGLAVAIAFGGRRVIGSGFGIGLVVRYVLETAHDVPEALAVLERMPVHMAYNVALQDTAGRNAVAYLSPDRPMTLGVGATAANRQGETEWPEHAEFCATEDREAALDALVADPETTTSVLVQHFLEPPLYRPTALSTWGTVYTAVYDTDARSLELRWPDDDWTLSLDDFAEGSRVRAISMALPQSVEPLAPLAVALHRPLLIA
jgi:predicted choloylglycine hydrolase